MNEIKTMPLIKLIKLLNAFIEEDNQAMINLCAFEITCRLYIIGGPKSFDEIAMSFGYKDIKKENVNILIK